MYNLIWIIPLAPLVGFLINVFAIRREREAGYVAVGAVGISFVVALLTFLQFMVAPPAIEPPRVDFVVWEWMSLGTFYVPFGLLFDPLSGVMVLLVTGVGSLIHIYSIGYMHGDPRVVRYFAYLNLFVAMMLFLVMADNMLLLFLGWEGVGLCSFLLIGFWFERSSASSAAVKAFVVNRIGDAAFLLAIMAIFSYFGTLNFFDISRASGGAITGFVERAEEIALLTMPVFGQPIAVATVISFLLLIGAAGKSAQIPLFVWLPDAMAGPTPVSALIHAATMVTAGVYLIVRVESIFNLSPATQTWVMYIGALTAIVAASAAIAQWDIKRVLAYSTVSQLGFMIAAAGMGAYAAAIFHLLTHGIFKALLFLGSGSVIHGTHDTQDMRKMGGLRKQMPRTFITYLIGAAALSGIFPLAGFWSKDEIIAHAWTHDHFVIFILLFLASLMTAFYMGRQVALVFFGKQRDTSYHAHESGNVMTWPLLILAGGAAIAGVLNLPGLHWLTSWLEPVLHEEAAEFGLTQLVLALIATVGAVGSAYLGWFFYTRNEAKVQVDGRDPLRSYAGRFWDVLQGAWYIDDAYEKYTVVPGFRRVSDFLARIIDPRGIDGAVRLVGRSFGWASAGVRATQSGYVRTYAFVFLIGVVLILGFLALA